MDYTQLSLFGRMSQEHSAATKEKTSVPCWKSLPTFGNRPLQFLDLRKENGANLDSSAGNLGALLGDCSMLNTGERPNEENESHLWWILEANAPEKFYLSAKACQGILNRASKRGKTLPHLLKIALEQQLKRFMA